MDIESEDKDGCIDMLLDILIECAEEHLYCAADKLSDYRKSGDFHTHTLCDHFGTDCKGCAKYCIDHIFNGNEEHEGGG